jgi:hypothetical protein
MSRLGLAKDLQLTHPLPSGCDRREGYASKEVRDGCEAMMRNVDDNASENILFV